MPTAPTPITPYATPPSSSDPTNFDARADAKVADDASKVAEYNALASNVFANAQDAAASAATATTQAAASAAAAASSSNSAQSAAASAGAPAWVSGTVYALGAVVWSPSTGYIYRRMVAGGGVADPSADPTNWALAGTAAPQLVISTTTANALLANQHLVLTNAAASTATLPPAPAAGDVLWVSAGNGRTDNVIARNGLLIMGLAEDMTIDGATATVSLRYINAGLGWRLV